MYFNTKIQHHRLINVWSQRQISWCPPWVLTVANLYLLLTTVILYLMLTVVILDLLFTSAILYLLLTTAILYLMLTVVILDLMLTTAILYLMLSVVILDLILTAAILDSFWYNSSSTEHLIVSDVLLKHVYSYSGNCIKLYVVLIFVIP